MKKQKLYEVNWGVKQKRTAIISAFSKKEAEQIAIKCNYYEITDVDVDTDEPIDVELLKNVDWTTVKEGTPVWVKDDEEDEAHCELFESYNKDKDTINVFTYKDKEGNVWRTEYAFFELM